jgi:hypothetical protein
MNTTLTLKSVIGSALLAGGLTLASLGPGAGNARALTGPYQWCPGQPLPATGMIWDMNVCHTYYKVGYGQGNVANDFGGPPGVPSIWDGDNPPAPTVFPCTPLCP